MKDYEEHIKKFGPSRVLINKDGEALPPSRAKERGHTYSVVFVRDDGWSLGAPKNLEAVAQSMYPEEWIGVIRLPDTKIAPLLRVLK
jgi:hypothetical protein